MARIEIFDQLAIAHKRVCVCARCMLHEETYFLESLMES